MLFPLQTGCIAPPRIILTPEREMEGGTAMNIDSILKKIEVRDS